MRAPIADGVRRRQAWAQVLTRAYSDSAVRRLTVSFRLHVNIDPIIRLQHASGTEQHKGWICTGLGLQAWVVSDADPRAAAAGRSSAKSEDRSAGVIVQLLLRKC